MISTSIYVHTLGDSTSDNYWWIIHPNSDNETEANEHCVEGRLETHLNTGSTLQYEVVSHAYDGFTTSEVLGGGKIGRVLPGFEIEGNRDAYKTRKINYLAGGTFTSPLVNLKTSVDEHPYAIHYVVINVGGNDFRERNPFGMLTEIPRVRERYLRILETVENLGNRNVCPILMFQYRTDAKNDPYHIYTVMKVIGVFFSAAHLLSAVGMAISVVALIANKINRQKGVIFALLNAAVFGISTQIIPLKATLGILRGQNIGITMLGIFMEKFYRPIVAKAKEKNISILDLPNTFNPFEDLYISGIEPNKAGGDLIAEGISHIVKGYLDFEEEMKNSSWIYYNKNGEKYTGHKNTGKYEVDYIPNK